MKRSHKCLNCAGVQLSAPLTHATTSRSLLLSWFYVLLSVLLLIGCSVACNAHGEPTSSWWNDAKNYAVKGYMRYVSTDGNGYPVASLDDSRVHEIRFSSDAERCLYRSTYLSNSQDNTLMGYVDNYFRADLPFAGELAVRQQVRYGNNTREGTVYYNFEVTEIQTDLINRPKRQTTVINIFIAGFILITIFTIFRKVGTS